MRFQEMTSWQLRNVDREQTLVVLPIAACEQHGPHMPTGTDTIICGSIAEQIELEMSDSILLLPTMWLGASSHHLRFGATLTAELDTYIGMLTEIARPILDEGFRRLMLLNGHGGNVDPLRVALRELQTEYPDCLLAGSSYWSIASEEIADHLRGNEKVVGHACEAETCLMLHLRPELVDTAQVADMGAHLPDEVEGMFVCRDMVQRTKLGATGRPDLATAEQGKSMFEAIVARVKIAFLRLLEENPTGFDE